MLPQLDSGSDRQCVCAARSNGGVNSLPDPPLLCFGALESACQSTAVGARTGVSFGAIRSSALRGGSPGRSVPSCFMVLPSVYCCVHCESTPAMIAEIAIAMSLDFIICHRNRQRVRMARAVGW